MHKKLSPYKLIEKLTINNFNFYRLLKIAALVGGGIFQFVHPVLAESTTVGRKISNTATVGYDYPNSSEAKILDHAISNTVELTLVEEVGITVFPQKITDSTGGTVVAENLLYYDFLFTNIGNEPTRFFTLGQVTVRGFATVNSITAMLDGNATFETTISSSGVYDKSSDQSPSNYKDNCSPGSDPPNDRVANTTLQGRDTNNDNTGTGGEVTCLHSF